MRLIESAGGTSSGAAGTNSSTPELKELVTEATRALARLDVSRLEELALSCQALTRIPMPTASEEQERFTSEASAARGEMAVFARVLEATRANLKVMERLRELRVGNARYAEPIGTFRSFRRKDAEGLHGNN